MSKRRPFQGTRLWREEMAARQAVPEKPPAPDLVGELVEALEHVVYSNHEFNPDACSGCAKAQRLISTKRGALARAKEQGR